MNALRQLHELGQSVWLDNITRSLLDDGRLARYIAEDAVTGLTSNPSIFDAAIGSGTAYDADIAAGVRARLAGEPLFMHLALADLRRAADLFRPIFNATQGIDGWVSMEISPLLAEDADASLRSALSVHSAAARPNLYVKIPGTPASIPAIEEAIFEGVPINVTLLFCRDHYLAAANAYLRGLERRLAIGRDLAVSSVASVFISRWDVAANPRLPAELRNRLGTAVAHDTYRGYLELLASPRWQALAALGARPQRLLWASTGTKDPTAPDSMYVSALAAPDTIDTMPEATLRAFAEHGRIAGVMQANDPASIAVLESARVAGVEVVALAETLQRDGAAAFVKSWRSLLQRIDDKVRAVTGAPVGV